MYRVPIANHFIHIGMSIPKKISLLLNNSVDSEILENCTKKKIFIKKLVTFTKEMLNGMESFMGSLIETNFSTSGSWSKARSYINCVNQKHFLLCQKDYFQKLVDVFLVSENFNDRGSLSIAWINVSFFHGSNAATGTSKTLINLYWFLNSYLLLLCSTLVCWCLCLTFKKSAYFWHLLMVLAIYNDVSNF